MRILSLVVAMIVMSGIAWKVTAAEDALVAASPAEAISPAVQKLMADRIMGSPQAPVTIVEYSSLICPHCAAFSTDTLPLLKTDYIDTGKVRLISRDFPINGTGLKAAMIARCVDPVRYFAVSEMLFKQQKDWANAADPVAAMSGIGKLAGLSDSDLKRCLANNELANAIAAEELDAENKYKVESTPTFILNDGADRIKGAESYDRFKSAIDKLLVK